MTNGSDDLALVLGGGGAHAAYQVGFLRCLANRFPDLRIPILTGISAGSINAAFIANHRGTFREAIDALSDMWCHLTMEQVYDVKGWSLAKSLLHWGIHLLSGGLANTAAPGLLSIPRPSALSWKEDSSRPTADLQEFARISASRNSRPLPSRPPTTPRVRPSPGFRDGISPCGRDPIVTA